MKIDVTVVYLGSDLRPDYIDGLLCRDAGIYKNIFLKKQKLKIVEKYAKNIIAPSSCGQMNERDFYDLISINLPHPDISVPVSNGIETSKKETINILHAPSDYLLKGTSIIRNIILELKQDYKNINYVEISGLPASSVFHELQKCDFVIDQMYSDVPFASFATEAAYFGKPAIVGGYYCEFIKSNQMLANASPSIYVHPKNLKNSVRAMIEDEVFRNRISKDVKKYVHEKANPQECARRVMAIIDGSAPDVWKFYPKDCRYFGGLGLEEEHLRKVLRDYIDKYGAEALMVSDKPDLQQAMLAFAAGDNSLPGPIQKGSHP